MHNNDIMNFIFKYVDQPRMIMIFHRIIYTNTVMFLIRDIPMSKFLELTLIFKYTINHIEYDWNKISKFRLDIEFIRDHCDKINWKIYCRHNSLDIDTIREFKHEIDWYELSKHKLNNYIKTEFRNSIKIVTRNVKPYIFNEFSIYIKDCLEKQKLTNIPYYQHYVYISNIMNRFVKTFHNLYLEDEVQNNILTFIMILYTSINFENFINFKKMNLVITSRDIIKYQLSHKIIREFSQYVDWQEVSKSIVIKKIYTEEFIKEFDDKLNWNIIYKNEKIKKFIL